LQAKAACARESGWTTHLRNGRAKRIGILLAIVWIAQICDLWFTIVAHRHGILNELNPLGLWALKHGTAVVAAYKVTLLAFGSAILWACRRRATSEYLLWLVAAASIGLSLRWNDYFAIYADCGPDPCIVRPHPKPGGTSASPAPKKHSDASLAASPVAVREHADWLILRAESIDTSP
jgi:hypothetical protein